MDRFNVQNAAEMFFRGEDYDEEIELQRDLDLQREYKIRWLDKMSQEKMKMNKIKIHNDYLLNKIESISIELDHMINDLKEVMSNVKYDSGIKCPELIMAANAHIKKSRESLMQTRYRN